MVLGDVEEVITTRQLDEETYEEIINVCIIESLTIFWSFYCTTKTEL
jgi:hypothetical protein